jgi:hypothetical protein
VVDSRVRSRKIAATAWRLLAREALGFAGGSSESPGFPSAFTYKSFRYIAPGFKMILNTIFFDLTYDFIVYYSFDYFSVRTKRT